VLRARLYPEDYGWDIRERWQDNASEVLIEDGRRPFLKSLEGSRLFISDHLGTTFYEAMAANHPTILFFDPDANPLRTEVCLSMDTLRLCGIVHETPESAAQAAMAAYPDVEKWWNDPDRQAAREDFCTRFARTVDSPIDEWLEELLQFVRDPKVKRDAVT
jgi:putative transferase (TIGR04331 family)